MKITIDGRDFDTLPDDLGDLTGRELGVIKRLSGVRLGELDEATKAGDYDVIIALALIAMRRAGVDVTEDKLLDLPIGRIEVEWNDQEDEADPPAPAAEPSGGSLGLETPSEPTGPPLSQLRSA